ncbi:hypothetical protein Ancab_004262 [Ancistrocladus abbreviatus]
MNREDVTTGGAVDHSLLSAFGLLFLRHTFRLILPSLDKTDQEVIFILKIKAIYRSIHLEVMGECRPLGFLLGLPFALAALLLSAAGLIVWILGSILSCVCPCCPCIGGIANGAMSIVKLPVKVSGFTAKVLSIFEKVESVNLGCNPPDE